MWQSRSTRFFRFGELARTAPILLGQKAKVEQVISPRTAQAIGDPTAKFIPEITFQEVLVKGLAVMDSNAFGLCKDNGLPIVVMNVNQPGAIARVLAGERVGTLVR